MSKIIVADTSPLIAFGLIDNFYLLSQIFTNIIIPQTVADECLTDKTWPGTSAITKAVTDKIIQIYPDPLLKKSDNLLNVLDKGEATAIKLAQSEKVPLIIDEKFGRAIAKKLNIKIIGTAGILLLAKQKKLITKVKPIILDLKNKGYYLSDTLIIEVLKLAKET